MLLLLLSDTRAACAVRYCKSFSAVSPACTLFPSLNMGTWCPPPGPCCPQLSAAMLRCWYCTAGHSCSRCRSLSTCAAGDGGRLNTRGLLGAELWGECWAEPVGDGLNAGESKAGFLCARNGSGREGEGCAACARSMALALRLCNRSARVSTGVRAASSPTPPSPPLPVASSWPCRSRSTCSRDGDEPQVG